MFPAPFYGYGSGNYRLTAVREIKVTDDFMGLDLKTINCQNMTTLHDCQQAKYLSNLTKKCQCIPFYLRSYSSSYQEVQATTANLDAGFNRPYLQQ